MPQADEPTPAEGALTEGWAWLHNATKWHYFRAGTSLCGKWALWTTPSEGFKPDQESPDNCVDCWRRRQHVFQEPPADQLADASLGVVVCESCGRPLDDSLHVEKKPAAK